MSAVRIHGIQATAARLPRLMPGVKHLIELNSPSLQSFNPIS